MDSKWPVTVPQEVRFVDIDALGHVNNALYLTYFEQARVAMLTKYFGDPFKNFKAFPFIIARSEVDYKAPICMGDQVETRIAVGRVGEKSFDLEYEVLGDGKLAATGKTVQVAYDYKTGGSVPLEEDMRARLMSLKRS